MSAVILDGRTVLSAVKSDLATRVAALAREDLLPGLGTVQVGDDPASHWYVGAKNGDFAEIGMRSVRRELPATARNTQLSRPQCLTSAADFRIMRTGRAQFAMFTEAPAGAAQYRSHMA